MNNDYERRWGFVWLILYAAVKIIVGAGIMYALVKGLT